MLHVGALDDVDISVERVGTLSKRWDHELLRLTNGVITGWQVYAECRKVLRDVSHEVRRDRGGDRQLNERLRAERVRQRRRGAYAAGGPA